MRKPRVLSRTGCSIDKVNKYGINAILHIMRDFNYDTETELFLITDKIQKRYAERERERYSINYIYEVKIILEHIKKENLLERL